MTRLAWSAFDQKALMCHGLFQMMPLTASCMLPSRHVARQERALSIGRNEITPIVLWF